jgi:3-deoxy-manno-octulosonate cytidylyltransferase (CMP-KDO synthetase)
MKILGVIPSRYGSSRFPGKPLIDLAGKSMIRRVYERVSESNFINHLVVATDDSRIFDHVTDFGGHVVMTSKEHQSGTDRCGEVMEQYGDFDVVINIQGDEPMINPLQIDQLVQVFCDEDVQIATLAKLVDKQEDLFNPNRIKLITNHKGDAIYFSRQAIPFIQNLEQSQWLDAAQFLRHIGIYAFRSQVLKEIVRLSPPKLELHESLEQLRWLYNGYSIRVVETNIESPNIDTPDDVLAVLNMLK